MNTVTVPGTGEGSASYDGKTYIFPRGVPIELPEEIADLVVTFYAQFPKQASYTVEPGAEENKNNE